VRIAPVAVGEVPAAVLSFEAWDELDVELEGVDFEADDDDELDGGGGGSSAACDELEETGGEVVITVV
jgi:hypothetical protein